MSEGAARLQAAEKYKPDATRVLFIAEAPPNELERYFYFENVKDHDWLWRGLMKALFANEFGQTRLERKRKAYWLRKFRDSGYQLIDAVEEPISGSDRRRREAIKNNADRLLAKVREIKPSKIVLIKPTVHEGLFTALTKAGCAVVNERTLPFPASGHQREFHVELRQLIDSGKLRIP